MENWPAMEQKMENARRHVMGKYTSKVVASRYDQLFQQLCS